MKMIEIGGRGFVSGIVSEGKRVHSGGSVDYVACSKTLVRASVNVTDWDIWQTSLNSDEHTWMDRNRNPVNALAETHVASMLHRNRCVVSFVTLLISIETHARGNHDLLL